MKRIHPCVRLRSIYTFNAIPLKISVSIFMELDRSIPKFIWKICNSNQETTEEEGSERRILQLWSRCTVAACV